MTPTNDDDRRAAAEFLCPAERRGMERAAGKIKAIIEAHTSVSFKPAVYEAIAAELCAEITNEGDDHCPK